MNTETEALPIRDRVEVIIRNQEDKFLLIFGGDPQKYPNWRAFPGGGQDDMTPEEACITECLEEVGIRVKNVTHLKVNQSEKHVSGKGDRREQYRGSFTRWYGAEFEAMDNSKLGADNDIRQYEWLTYEEALKALQKSGGNRVRSQQLALGVWAGKIGVVS